MRRENNILPVDCDGWMTNEERVANPREEESDHLRNCFTNFRRGFHSLFCREGGIEVSLKGHRCNKAFSMFTENTKKVKMVALIMISSRSLLAY